MRTKRLPNRRALVSWAVLLAMLCSVISQLCHLSTVAVYACVCLLAVCACVCLLAVYACVCLLAVCACVCLLAVCACVVTTPFAAVDRCFCCD